MTPAEKEYMAYTCIRHLLDLVGEPIDNVTSLYVIFKKCLLIMIIVSWALRFFVRGVPLRLGLKHAFCSASASR